MSLSLNRIVALAGCALLGVACAQDSPTAPALAAAVGMEAVTGAGSEAGTITLIKVRENTAKCIFKVALKGLYDDPNTGADYYTFYFGPADRSWANTFGPIVDDLDITPRGTFRGEWEVDQYIFGTGMNYSLWFARSDQFSSAWKAIPSADFKFVNRCF